MEINRTASYSPSYTANYAEAQSAQRKASTKVMVVTEPANNPKIKLELANTQPKKLGVHLSAKA